METVHSMPIKAVKRLPNKGESKLVHFEPFELAAGRITDETDTGQSPICCISAIELLSALRLAVLRGIALEIDLLADTIRLTAAKPNSLHKPNQLFQP